MGASDILSRTGGEGPSAADFVGQTVTVTDFELTKGGFGEYVIVEGLVDDEIVSFKTGAVAIVSKLKDLKNENLLPITVVVTSYPSSFPGKPGYDIREPGDEG